MQLLRPLFALLLLLSHAPVQADPGAAEACIAQDTNAARTAVGVPTLPVSSQLSDEARAHSQQMASTNTLYHSTIRSQYGNQWTLIGENVGTNSNCDIVQQAFLNSPHHYENMTNKVWTSFGVGVVYGGSGSVWITVAFVEGGSAPAPPTTQPAPAPARTTAQPALPRPAPTTAAPAPAAAPPAATVPVPTFPATPVPTAAAPTATGRVLPASSGRLVSAKSGFPVAIVGLLAALILSMGAVGVWTSRLGRKRWRT